MIASEKVLEFKAKCAHGWTGSPSKCKDCRRVSYADRTKENPDLRSKVIITEEGRNCLKCGEIKSWNEFHKDIHGFNQKTATCKSCRNEKGQRVYRENPDVRRLGGLKNRPDKLMRDYGITYADVVRALDKQHGRCANLACGKEISLEVNGTRGNRAVIDHNHKTGKFRALMCIRCNSMMGTLETNENMLIGLMDYLSKHK